jgi:uncharacterized protein DUF3883
MNLNELREYQLDFERDRIKINSAFNNLFQLREKFVKDYSIENILSFELDDYVIGKQMPTFCHRIENELNAWGNIHGSTAKKFGIYFGVDGEDKEKIYRIGKRAFGMSVNKAFENIKTSITELIINKDDLSSLKRNIISPMFKGKILSVYFPDSFLNIFSSSHLNYFINMLGLENNSKSELNKQKQLLDYKNTDSIMKDWSVFQFSKFLYHSFGRPNDELKDDKLPNELKKFKLKDFPPIEDVKFEFINLKTEESYYKKSKHKKKNQKTDYSTQSKIFKRIGDRGEQIVVKAERQLLIKKGKTNLAKKVDHISNKDDTVGYDIISYDIDGNEKFIEVKSTLKPVGMCNIFISANELGIAQSKENYFIYIVYEVGSKTPKI